jgi:predicted metal-dependent RNase
MRHLKLIIVTVAFAGLLAGPSSSDQLKVASQDAAPVPLVTVLGSKQAEGILGKEVRSSADENMGRIVDVIVDRSGQVRAAVIDFGGFLGVGSRKIAVDWGVLSFAPTEKRDVVTIELTREQVKTAPEYKDKRAVIVLGAAGPLPVLPE